MFKEELIIVRHARSMHNIRNSDGLDESITTFGKKQAANVGQFFKHELDVSGFQFYTSPFLRCLQTTEAVWADINQPWNSPIIMPQLREYLNHSGKNVEIPNRKTEYPYMDWEQFPETSQKYEEEFNETFLLRMHEAHDLLPEYSVVFSHGLPALTLMHIAINPTLTSVPIWDHSIDNCSITIIRKGRLVWHGRNLYHEMDYDSKFYRRDWDGVVKPEHETI